VLVFASRTGCAVLSSGRVLGVVVTGAVSDRADQRALPGSRRV